MLQQVLTQGSSIAIVELCCSEHSNLRKMSLFWKKMKALFLQTKICEVSQIRINKNPLGLVVNKHLLKVETSNQTW